MLLKLILILILILIINFNKISSKKSKINFKKIRNLKIFKTFKNRKSLKSRIFINNYPLYYNEEVVFIDKKDRILIHIFKECRFIYSKNKSLKVNGALCGVSLSGNEIIHN